MRSDCGVEATQTTVVTGEEMFRKVLDEGQAGDNIGVLAPGTKKRMWSRMALAKPKSITPQRSSRRRSMC